MDEAEEKVGLVIDALNDPDNVVAGCTENGLKILVASAPFSFAVAEHAFVAGLTGAQDDRHTRDSHQTAMQESIRAHLTTVHTERVSSVSQAQGALAQANADKEAAELNRDAAAARQKECQAAAEVGPATAAPAQCEATGC